MSAGEYKESREKEVAQSKRNSKRLTQHVLRRFRAEQYDKLKQELSSPPWGEQKVTEFFLSGGYPILSWAIDAPSNPKALNFLYETMGVDTLKAVLLPYTAQALQGFLYVQAGAEGTPRDTEQWERYQVEKFKLLLQIDSKAVTAFMEEKATEEAWYLTQKIKTNFTTAQRELREGAVKKAGVGAKTTETEAKTSSKKEREKAQTYLLAPVYDPVSAEVLVSLSGKRTRFLPAPPFDDDSDRPVASIKKSRIGPKEHHPGCTHIVTPIPH